MLVLNRIAFGLNFNSLLIIVELREIIISFLLHTAPEFCVFGEKTKQILLIILVENLEKSYMQSVL